MGKAKAKRRLFSQPQPVIDRWLRLKLSKLFKNLTRAYMRQKLPRTERKSRAALEATFETVKELAIKNEGGKFKGFSTLYNIALYLLIADRDIQALKIDVLTHHDEWARRLSARVILLTIYEWDADKVCGRELKNALEIMQTPQDLRREATEALRALRLVQRKANKQFAYVRNTAIAHRDPDSLKQYRAIRDLRIDQVIEVSVEFFAAAEKLIGVLTKLIHAGNNYPSLLRQWISSSKNNKE